MKQKDGYIIADNNFYDPSSPFRVAKAELSSFFKGKKRSGTPTPSEAQSISKYIALAAQEYKIHLMPKPVHMEKVVTRLIRKMGEDPQLRRHVAQYKVLLGEKTEDQTTTVPVKKDSHDGYYPRIVLYAESKEAAQAILNAICTLFPDADHLGDGIVPRDNKQVNALIYYAHGSGDIKNLANECNFELFKEKVPGEFDLQIPQ